MVNGLGLDFDGLLAQEPEPGLGNGGLGRLAACFIDSLATLEIPTLAYGIRYEFGIFQQEIVDGWQVEKTDKWLKFGNPWELPRPEWAVPVQFGGYTERYQDEHGRLRVRWVPSRLVNGVPYDTPVLGYHNNTANTLAALARRSARVVRFLRIQPRRLLRRRQPEGDVGESHQSSLSERRADARQGAAARAAVLLRIVLAAGHVPRHGGAASTARQVPREVRGAAERHAPGDRRRRAHATPRRRARRAVGDRVGHHAAHDGLHESHSDAGSSRVLAARSVPAHLAAPPRDHLRDQRPVPRRRARAHARRRRASRSAVADRRARRALRAHGASRVRRQPCDQRRGRAPHGALEEQRAQGLLRPVARALLESHQRRDAAALAQAREPAARAAAARDPRRRLGTRSRRARGSRALRRRCGIPRPLGRHQARQQGRARSARRERRGHAARSRIAIRRASEADPRVQAAALEHTARRRSISPVEERLRSRLRRAPSSSAAKPRPGITLRN